MKQLFFTLFLAIMATTGLFAQQISVVTPGGDTSLFRTLPEAIKGAAPGSVIYLPGGGFSIPDSVKITKKLTIIGIGHKSNNDNVDGITTISGNLFFNQGSSGSAVIGCYITGNVNIGEGGAAVNDVLIRYCNLNSVQILSSTCQDTEVNQNFIRSNSEFNSTNGLIHNNIAYSLSGVKGGRITYNIITASVFAYTPGYTRYFSSIKADESIITNNILISRNNAGYLYGSNCSINHNMTQDDWGDYCISIGDTSWGDIFIEYNNGAVSPASNFHFKEAYKQYENQVGVYANGVDFDKQLAPVPYIVAKQIPEQTDASGKLNIKIRVKAGE
ncbi:MAG: hypothetical protein II947_02270 [Bacteroidaceae bacterium]|nr:hypothetical protein [Bacteroidaceae bacterium]